MLLVTHQLANILLQCKAQLNKYGLQPYALYFLLIHTVLLANVNYANTIIGMRCGNAHFCLIQGCLTDLNTGLNNYKDQGIQNIGILNTQNCI